MKTINTHIEEVLGRFDNQIMSIENTIRLKGYSGTRQFLRDFLQQSLLTLHAQTLEQIREGVEELTLIGTNVHLEIVTEIEGAEYILLKKSDVLDLLINSKTHEKNISES